MPCHNGTARLVAAAVVREPAQRTGGVGWETLPWWDLSRTDWPAGQLIGRA